MEDKQTKTLVMKHDYGAQKEVIFLGAYAKRFQARVPGVGLYEFKLRDGECVEAPFWFIEGEDLEFVREVARKQKLKFNTFPRTPQHKRPAKTQESKKEKGSDPRQMDLF